MQRSRSVALTAWSAAVLATLIRPAPADACSVPGESLSVRDTPANGAVLLDLYCPWDACFDGVVPDNLPIIDKATGLSVPGEVVHVGGDLTTKAVIAWRPSAPLTAGATYVLDWQPTGTSEVTAIDFEFQALPAVSWSIDALELDAYVSIQDEVTRSVSCEPRFYGSCIGESVALETGTYVMLFANIDRTAAVGSEGQLLVTSAFWAGDEDEPAQQPVEPFLYESQNQGQRFDALAGEYCYRVVLTSLIDGSTAEHFDCIENTISDLPTTQSSEAGINASLDRCRSAPEGLEQPWCKLRREQCAAPARDEDLNCPQVAVDCADVPLDEPGEPHDPNDPDPDEPDASDDDEPNVPGDPNDPMSPPDGPATGEAVDDETDDDMAMEPGPVTRTACSAGFGRADDFSSAVLLSLFAIALRVRRRVCSKGEP